MSRTQVLMNHVHNSCQGRKQDKIAMFHFLFQSWPQEIGTDKQKSSKFPLGQAFSHTKHIINIRLTRWRILSELMMSHGFPKSVYSGNPWRTETIYLLWTKRIQWKQHINYCKQALTNIYTLSTTQIQALPLQSCGRRIGWHCSLNNNTCFIKRNGTTSTS